MLTRRTATSVMGATVLLVMPPGLVRHAGAQPSERAVGFIKSTSDRLVAIVNGSAPAQEKHWQLRNVIGSTVDVGMMVGD
jgi:hypothetical protein